MKIQLDMYQTIAVAVVVLMLGKFLKERVSLLERFCIPAPVIGGVIFAIFTCPLLCDRNRSSFLLMTNFKRSLYGYFSLPR